MDYLNETIKIEDKLYRVLQSDELESFEELLNTREEIYRSFSQESPEKFREYLDSEAFRDIKNKINKLYEEKRENIRNEMNDLARSRKAAGEYIGNSGAITSVFSKTV